jgi:hypothetical protein
LAGVSLNARFQIIKRPFGQRSSNRQFSIPDFRRLLQVVFGRQVEFCCFAAQARGSGILTDESPTHQTSRVEASRESQR